jgi:hypothetical protein
MSDDTRDRNGLGCLPSDGRGKPRMFIVMPPIIRAKPNPTPTMSDLHSNLRIRDNDTWGYVGLMAYLPS